MKLMAEKLGADTGGEWALTCPFLQEVKHLGSGVLSV